MPFIPRPVKPPASCRLTCQVPEATVAMLKRYVEFLESTQAYVVDQTLREAFRRDREFQAWLAASHPGTRPVQPPASSLKPPVNTARS
jgi:hypothetical protein